MITCTIFSSSILSTVASNISNTLSTVLDILEVFTDEIFFFLLGLLTKKLQIERLFLSVHHQTLSSNLFFFPF